MGLLAGTSALTLARARGGGGKEQARRGWGKGRGGKGGPTRAERKREREEKRANVLGRAAPFDDEVLPQHKTAREKPPSSQPGPVHEGAGEEGKGDEKGQRKTIPPQMPTSSPQILLEKQPKNH